MLAILGINSVDKVKVTQKILLFKSPVKSVDFEAFIICCILKFNHSSVLILSDVQYFHYDFNWLVSLFRSLSSSSPENDFISFSNYFLDSVSLWSSISVSISFSIGKHHLQPAWPEEQRVHLLFQ